MQSVRPQSAKKRSLPPEVLFQVFEQGDFTPDVLLVVARELSKCDNDLSLIARSPAVWRKWHPEAVVHHSLVNPGSENLALRFLNRVRNYPTDVRKALAVSYQTRFSVDSEFLQFVSTPDESFLQMYSYMASMSKGKWLHSNKASVWPPEHLRPSTANDLQSFDSMLALLRWGQSYRREILNDAHVSFWDEKAFVDRSLQVSDSYRLKASARLQNISEFRAATQED